MSTAQALRRPSFLGRVGDKPRVESAACKPGNEGRFHPPVLVSALPNSDDGDSREAANAVVEAKKLAAQFTERTSAAVDLLRATAERLAAEARTDALEIGFLVAHRILEMELSASAPLCDAWASRAGLPSTYHPPTRKP